MYTSITICLLVVGAALCAPERADRELEAQSPREAQENDPNAHDSTQPSQLKKRSSPYDLRVGKRAYSYVSEYKRLPVYNFGLGKRSRPYSFGLGKRSVDVVDDQYPNELDQEMPADLDLEQQYDDNSLYEKRARPFSFGLGKRYADEDMEEEKRSRMYDFGLGKRLPSYNFGLGKRTRTYNFGLGKRLSSKFNFGLGKRERDLHRFSFGLGKRSDDTNDDGDTLKV